MSSPWDLDADVVVAGTGGAGLAAAIEARRAGATVLMLDCDASFGGASVISGGGCFIVGTPLQAQHGIEDSVDAAYEDWLAWGGETVDREWARCYIERSRPDLYDWFEALGVRWTKLKRQEGNRVLRWHQSPGGGREVTTALYDEARRLGVERWLWRTAAEEIVLRDGGVAGLRVRHLDDGTTAAVRCRALVVATGGFMSDEAMVRRYNPRLEGVPILLGAAPNATGSGHRLIERAGGALSHMDAMWIYAYGTPDYRDPDGRRGILVREIRGSVWVNAQGRRFHNEGRQGPASATPALLAQTPPRAWAILDGAMLDGLELAHPSFRSGVTPDRKLVREYLEASPFVHFEATLDALAAALRVPAGVFADTIERYNAAIREGRSHDPDQHKPLDGLRPLEVPPFVAITFMPTTRKNLGGVKTTLRCEVVRPDGSPIPGLYAAGELAGMAGGHINGARGLEGTMLGPAIFSGRVAGRWAARASASRQLARRN
jgi:predicted oxidoreductase